MSSERAKPKGLDEAINAVLQAEQDVAEKAEACAQQAAQRIRNARLAERRILNRAERRIHKLHRCRNDLIRRYLKEIVRAEAAAQSRPIETDADLECIARAAEAMADELLGA